MASLNYSSPVAQISSGTISVSPLETITIDVVLACSGGARDPGILRIIRLNSFLTPAVLSLAASPVFNEWCVFVAWYDLCF